MENGIRPAKKQDIPALCAIWKQCFPDSDDYIRYFYRENFERIEVPVYSLGGTPVSMLHLIDASLVDAERSQNAKLIYAAGTLPDHRGKGYMRALLKAVTGMADKKNLALFLKPASAHTQHYYQSFGFLPDGGFRLLDIAPTEASPLSVYALSAEEYNRRREAAFADIPHARWENDHIRWCMEENAYFSGKTLAIDYENHDYFLLGYPENGTLVINETNLSIAQLKALSGALCTQFQTKKITAYLPKESGAQGDASLPLLLYHAAVNHPYINLIMI